MPSDEQLASELASRSPNLVALESLVLIVIDILAISGNLLVCFVVYKTRRSQTVAKILIAALALTDLGVATLVGPLSIVALVSGRWGLNHATCVFQGFCMVTFATASMHTLALISINRYFCVVKPKLFRRFFTVKKTFSYVAGVWLVASLGSIPPLFFGLDDYAFQAGKALCLYPFELTVPYTICIDLVFIAVPMVVMVFCYSQVFKEVKASTGPLPRRSRASGVAQATSIREARITKTLVAVMLGFAVCWLPVGVTDIIDTTRGAPTLPRQFYLFYGFMAFLSSTINPFLYGVMSRRFRKEYVRILCCWAVEGSTEYQVETPRREARTTAPTPRCIACSISTTTSV